MLQVRHDWWDELNDMQQQMDRFLEHFSSCKRQPVKFAPGVWQPLVDVYESGDQVVVTAELAGVRREDVRIVLHNNILLLSGVRQDQRTAATRTYQVMEVNFGRFERAVELSTVVDPDSATAKLEDGFLVIAMSKAPAPTMKWVQLRTGEEAGERQAEK